MLQTDPQIVLRYKPAQASKVQAEFRIANTHPNQVISFKIKTTNPGLFNVVPTKGFLVNGKSKTIEIGLIGNNSEQDIRNIATKQKFQIEYITISEKLKEQDLQTEWKKAQAQKTIKKHKLNLKTQDGNGARASDILIDQDTNTNLFKSAYSSNPQSKQAISPQLSVQAVKLLNQTSTKTITTTNTPETVNQQREQKIKQIKKLSATNSKLIRISVLIAILIILLFSAHSVFIRNDDEFGISSLNNNDVEVEVEQVIA